MPSGLHILEKELKSQWKQDDPNYKGPLTSNTWKHNQQFEDYYSKIISPEDYSQLYHALQQPLPLCFRLSSIE